MHKLRTLLIALFLTAVLWNAPVLALEESSQPDAMQVLGDQSFWRFHAAWRTPATVAGGKYDLGGGYTVAESGTRWIRDSFTLPTPPPPDGWTATDFDDSTWARYVGPPFSGYGQGKAAEVYLLCGRIRFGVADPARVKQLELNLTYRGGAVVYLNGSEVARGHLPSSKIEPLTLAADYPKDASFGPKGKPLPSVSEKRGPSEELVKHYRQRFRILSIELPARLLRKGTNVLALEVHRAALPAAHMADASGGWNPTVGKNAWGTCGVQSISLTTPVASRLIANAGAVPDVQVWNCNTLLRPGVDFQCADPLETLRPVRLATPLGVISRCRSGTTRSRGGVLAATGQREVDVQDAQGPPA